MWRRKQKQNQCLLGRRRSGEMQLSGQGVYTGCTEPPAHEYDKVGQLWTQAHRTVEVPVALGHLASLWRQVASGLVPQFACDSRH